MNDGSHKTIPFDWVLFERIYALKGIFNEKIVVLVGAVETVDNSVMHSVIWDSFPNSPA
jgi:hypothetical protein